MGLKLFKHQQQALDSTEDQNKVAYYLDMGLGKTFVGSEKMKQLGSTVNILVCQKSLISTWFEHLCLHYGYEFVIYNLTEKDQFEMFIRVAIHSADKGFKFIGVINYDLTFRRPELLKLENFTMMLDESSVIQNESTKRSKFILKMKAENVILLSGTPTSGKYENLYSQLKLLGWKITKELYWKQYVDSEWVETEDGFFRRQVNGYKNVERLKQKLRQHGAVFMKSEEVFDLPDQIFNKIMVPASKEYKKFIRSGIIKIDDKELVGDTILTKRLYSRMLCGHYNKDKLDAFKDLLESTNDRLIVFYNFNDELATLAALVEERPISIINGSVKDLKAYEESDDSVTFVQYQAGSSGLNLQKANKLIYFTLPQSCEHYMQSQKRIHRIGQNQRCFYYYLLATGSVEEDILKALERGVDYTDDLFSEYEKQN